MKKKRYIAPRSKDISHKAAYIEAQLRAYKDPAIPMFLCLVCMVTSLVACLINAFVYPFGDNLLAPLILELLAIVFPCYLVLMVIYPKYTPAQQMRAVGFRVVGIRYIFFLIFAALFMMSVSVTVAIIFGGVDSAADGYSVLGTFWAGKNDFNVTWPYLILVYALVPAMAEELLLRGLVMTELSRVGFAARAAVSAVLSAMLGFSLGGAIPAMAAAIMSCFVLYTTGSLWACILVSFAFKLYRLFLETNIAQYYLSMPDRTLLLIVLFGALLIFGALFFSESSRLYRERAERLSCGEADGEKGGKNGTNSAEAVEKNEKSGESGEELSFGTFKADIKETVSYTPTLIMLCVSAAIFLAVVLINYFA